MIKSLSFTFIVSVISLGLAYWVNDTLAAWFLGVVFVLYSLSQAFHLRALHKWAVLRDKRDLPNGIAAWGPVFNRLRSASKIDLDDKIEMRTEFERIQAVVDHVPDGLIVLDQYDHILWYNNAARDLHEIFGFKRPIHHFIRQPEFFAYLATGTPNQSLKINLANRVGKTFEIRVVDSHSKQRLLMTRDITEASKIDVMRRDFVANVSHEIRTPVTVIGGFAETLLSIDLDKESQTTYLSTILTQSQTMQRLLEDLLTLSSLESGFDIAPKNPVDIHALLEMLTAEAKSLSNGRHKIRLAIDGPKTILGAQTEVETAARNLIVNALRYTPDGGEIEVSWHSANPAELASDQAFTKSHDVWLRVKDTGPGIAAEHIPRLTERFYRVDRGRSRDTGGTGLGLAIVKHVVQRHQAELVIESALGKGSQFSIGFHPARIARTSSTESATEVRA
jgi:two-component system, OmpR family, phosphate regulon sensor histidine kinase PhoR